jgi:hypothetical protein
MKVNIMIWLRLVWYIFWRGLLWGALEGTLLGTVIFPIIGTMFGLPIGACIGGVVGCINGLILARMIRRMHHYSSDSQFDGRIIRRAYIQANIIVTFLVLGALGLIVAVKPLGSQVPNILIFGGSIPAFIEGGRAAYHYVGYLEYAGSLLKDKPTRNVPMNVLS